jgi:cell division septation protein DedD
LTSHAQDDAFHEIQLNGKQLVFLFMAATVVSVVIFLCGVMVGRGVRAERAAIGGESAGTAAVEPTPQRSPAAPPVAGSDPTAAAPPQAVDDFSYFNRLEKPGKTTDDLKASASREVAVKASAVAAKPSKEPAASAAKQAVPAAKEAPRAAALQPVPAPVPVPTKETPKPAPKDATKDVARDAPKEPEPPRPVAEAAGAEAAQTGFAVQIAALNAKSEADAIARRLSSKGYAAYVLTPSGGTPAVYRVRIGKFGTRREAESIAAKLQREEQFKPWITR